MADEAAQAVAEEAVVDTAATESMLTGKEPTDANQQEAATTTEADGSEKPEGDKEQAQGAPEQYEPFAMPEGVELDTEMVEAFSGLAREHNLTQEQAQKFADFGAQIAQRSHESTVEALRENWTEMQAKWVDEIKADKEIGGEKLAESIAVARQAISTWGDDQLRAALEETGMTNHPALVRFAYRVGKALSDDTFHIGRQSGASRSVEDVLYPTMNKH